MTIAVCVFCGAEKNGSFIKCGACGRTPTQEIDVAYSLALSDHYFDHDTLKQIGGDIATTGERPNLPPEQEHRFLESARLFSETLGPVVRPQNSQIQQLQGGNRANHPRQPFDISSGRTASLWPLFFATLLLGGLAVYFANQVTISPLGILYFLFTLTGTIGITYEFYAASQYLPVRWPFRPSYSEGVSIPLISFILVPIGVCLAWYDFGILQAFATFASGVLGALMLTITIQSYVQYVWQFCALAGIVSIAVKLFK